MNDASFLSYFPDPFDVKDSRYFVRSQAGASTELTARQLSDSTGLLVTYETQVLVDDMRRAGVTPPEGLVNVDDAIRLRVGKARDEGGERLWNIWRNITPHFPDAESAALFENVVRSKIHRPVATEITGMLSTGAEALSSLWASLKSQLQDHGELDRFWSVDVPVQRIFHHRQSRGIAVNKGMAAGLLRQVANEKYLAYTKVADRLGRSPSGLGFWNIQPHLGRTDAADLSDEKDGGRLRELFKMASFRSEFARDYLAYSDSDRDETVLRRSSVPGTRLYPEFQAHGTVTGRILVSDPYLQQLRRRYRQIVAADQGKRLAYLDFCQFEPGILAFLSNDDSLVAAYNEGDLYEALSVAVFGDASSRPLSKRIFLAYSYGMTVERVAKLLLGKSADYESRTQLQASIVEFFKAYPALEHFRARMQEQLLRDNSVASLFGNHRWRANEGPLSQKEKRWAMNQPVQATASLIFKEALVAIAAKLGADSIVLPMHDAVLLQLPEDEYAAQVEEASRLMISAYSARCPTIKPRISFSDFAAP